VTDRSATSRKANNIMLAAAIERAGGPTAVA